MNSVVRQLWEQNTDIVMVDTGNSYEGLCEYVGGKYIAYTEDKPITMNPFNIDVYKRQVDDGFLHDGTADDVLYLLCHYAHARPELSGCLVLRSGFFLYI